MKIKAGTLAFAVIASVFMSVGASAAGNAFTKKSTHNVDYPFNKATIHITYETHKSLLGGPWCEMVAAWIENTSDESLGYVYTRLDSFNQGVTLASITMNYPPTIAGGKAGIAHADKAVIGGKKCDDIQVKVTPT